MTQNHRINESNSVKCILGNHNLQTKITGVQLNKNKMVPINNTALCGLALHNSLRWGKCRVILLIATKYPWTKHSIGNQENVTAKNLTRQ